MGERLWFGGNSRLSYRLARDDTVRLVAATFEDGCITVPVPAVEGLDWCSTGRTGIEATQNLRAGDIKICIEKDFACHCPFRRRDDDTFPNPLACNRVGPSGAGST